MEATTCLERLVQALRILTLFPVTEIINPSSKSQANDNPNVISEAKK